MSHTQAHTVLSSTLQVSQYPLLINNITSRPLWGLMLARNMFLPTHTHIYGQIDTHTHRNAHTKTHSRYPDALAPWEGPRNNHNSLLPSLCPADLCFKWAAGNWRGGCPSATTSACAVCVISIYYIVHAPWARVINFTRIQAWYPPVCASWGQPSSYQVQNCWLEVRSR